MDNQVEHEICANCKKEIPQTNYVMHTAHCARNITLCKNCNEPVPKNQFDDHIKKCEKRKVKKPSPPPTTLENSSYFQQRKAVDDKKAAVRKERYMQKMDRLVDTGFSLKETKIVQKATVNEEPAAAQAAFTPPKPKSNGLLPCKYCELELPKLDLEEHENYCGSRTDKCLECGEFVMFKYKQLHVDSNHGFLKLKDEPGPRASWDSTSSATRRSNSITETSTRRRPPVRSFTEFDYDPLPYMPSTYSIPGNGAIKRDKGESYKEISRRLDCKTEYIRNLLHDSAKITVPLRHSGAVPRNHFNHNKGPAPQPPSRRRNPPTELVIPCEFCGVPVPHEDLIQHETGCRPDLARFNPRRRSPELDDYFTAPPPTSPEEELPCEFCADMIPASQLLRHQATCI